MAQNSIWDDYSRWGGSGGWSPPAGIEGEPGVAWSTSGNQAWKDAQGGGGQPQPFSPTPTGNGNGGSGVPGWAKNLQNWGQNMINNRQSFFPAVGQFLGNNPAVQALNRPQQQYGTPAGGLPRLGRNGLSTYQLPSEGFATVKSGSRVPSYASANPTGNQFARPSPAEASQAGQTGNFQGFGGNTPFGVSFGLGRNPREDGVTSPGSSLGYQAGQGLARLGTLGYNAIASLFGGGQQNTQSQNFYAYNPSPVPYEKGKYFNF